MLLNLREFRRNPDRLSDLIPWAAFVAPGVMLNKDGSFQTTIGFRGPDLDSATAEELVVSSSHMNNILRRFGSGWAIFVEAKRSAANTYPESEWPDPVSYLIDRQRQIAFSSNTHFECRYYMTLVYLPPVDHATMVSNMFLASRQKDRGVSYARALENFIVEVNRAGSLMSRIFPEVVPLTEDETLTYLHSLISTKHHVVRTPEIPMYLDAVLADTPLLGGFEPMLGDQHLCSIGILGFPGSTQPALLDALNRLSIEYRFCTRFLPLDKISAKKELEGYQRKWFAKRKGVMVLLRELATKEESSLVDSDALQKAQDAEQALIELGSDEVAFGYYTATVVLQNQDRETLRTQTQEVERVINGHGFVTRVETVNAVDAWLGTLPGNTRNNVRRPLLNTMNLSHLMPGSSSVWAGKERTEHLNGPPLLVAETGGSTPFRLSLHVGDVGHTLVLGPTGSGKSTLLNLMECQFLRYPNAQVYIFDKGGSARALTAGVGGDFYDLGAESSKLAFQPLSGIDEDAERKWAQDWILGILHQENVEMTPDIKRSVWDALTALSTTPREHRTLYSLMVFLQNEKLRQALEPYTQNGPHGRLLDNAHDNLRYGKWQCFEMENVMQTPSVVVPVLGYLFHRLEARFTGAPTLLVLDEAWLFLDNEMFSAKIREWLKVLRKLNVAVVFASQSLSDVDRSSIAPTIREACMTKIYLPNAIAQQPESADFYKRFGLNARQIEILARAMPKRDYYYTSPLGNRLFDTAMDELTLAYCAGASPEQTALVKELAAKNPDLLDYNIAYLKRKGLEDAAKDLELLREVKESA